ncbi:DUF2813 domain-containing protein [Candidatus Bathyarchaeota archaeon]|nr:MAG: DUF2813 domain-containing protein [Candidatus Bathyarchaeota archaeon]
MFNSINLTEFRGIKKCEKPVEFSKFNLIIGANNSGKSSILEALSFFPDPWGDVGLPILRSSRPIIFRWLHGDMKSTVYGYSGTCTINYKFEGKTFTLKMSTDGRVEMKLDDKSFTDINRIVDVLAKSPTELTAYVVFIPVNDRFRENLSIGLIENWDTVEKTGASVRLVKQFISKVVADKFTEVIVRGNELRIRQEFPKEEKVIYVRLNDVGDGVKKFLLPALWIETLNPKVVLWDDLEVSAHPTLIRAVIEWMVTHDWQVIASTHSVDVLHEFVMSEPEDAKVIQLKRTNEGVLLWTELTPKDVEEFFEKGQDVRKLFM